MNLGEAYIWKDHLHVVISLPDKSGNVVVVNFTTWEANKDQSCIVEPGEHPWIKKRSVIAYKYADLLTPAMQKDFLRDAQRRNDVSNDLLERIQIGADETDRMPQREQDAVRESCDRQRKAKRAAAAAAAASLVKKP